MVPALFVMQDAYGVACEANGHSIAAARIMIGKFCFSIVSGGWGYLFWWCSLSADWLFGLAMSTYASASQKQMQVGAGRTSPEDWLPSGATFARKRMRAQWRYASITAAILSGSPNQLSQPHNTLKGSVVLFQVFINLKRFYTRSLWFAIKICNYQVNATKLLHILKK